MSGSTDLFSALEELLDASVEALDTNLIVTGLLGAPDRAFVSPGPPAIDCCPQGGQLTVHADLISDAPLGTGLQQGRLIAGKVNHVLATIIIARCVVDNRGQLVDLTEPPLAADMETVAAQTDADIWALWNCLYGLWTAGDLFTICGELFFEGARSFLEGGCAGWRLSVRFSLDGYQCLAST